MFKTIYECELKLVSSTKFESGASAVSEDFMPVTAARVSFGMDGKTGQDVDKDIKLIKYLAEHEHMTPFESLSATFLIEVPLFIRSQIMRHRTFSYSEISRRYTDENLEFWIPDTFRKQSESNRQASTGEVPEDAEASMSAYKMSCDVSLENYYELIGHGVCREQARAVLPQSLLTKFYLTGNLRNLAHFIELRKDAHAQKEVQVVAKRIEDELRKLWPNSVGALLGD